MSDYYRLEKGYPGGPDDDGPEWEDPPECEHCEGEGCDLCPEDERPTCRWCGGLLQDGGHRKCYLIDDYDSRY